MYFMTSQHRESRGDTLTITDRKVSQKTLVVFFFTFFKTMAQNFGTTEVFSSFQQYLDEEQDIREVTLFFKYFLRCPAAVGIKTPYYRSSTPSCVIRSPPMGLGPYHYVPRHGVSWSCIRVVSLLSVRGSQLQYSHCQNKWLNKQSGFI